MQRGKQELRETCYHTHHHDLACSYCRVDNLQLLLVGERVYRASAPWTRRCKIPHICNSTFYPCVSDGRTTTPPFFLIVRRRSDPLMAASCRGARTQRGCGVPSPASCGLVAIDWYSPWRHAYSDCLLTEPLHWRYHYRFSKCWRQKGARHGGRSLSCGS